MNRYKLPLVLITSLIILFLVFTDAGNCYDLEKNVKTYTLSNGIRVLLLERHLSPTVSFYIRQRVGSADEPEGKTGMAHFLEHMMFKGTKTIGTKNYSKEKKILEKISTAGNALDFEARKGMHADRSKLDKLLRELDILQKEHGRLILSNEINRLYTENGGLDMNASTSQDMTTYHVSLPSDKIELWARIESDRIMNPIFREFYTERKVVMEERRQRIESVPDGKLMNIFYSLAFTKHPYGRPVLGLSSDIPYISMDDLYNFQKIASDPGKTVIAVVGDINPKTAMKIINKYFAAIPKRKYPPVIINAEPTQVHERRRDFFFDSNPRIIMGYHKPSAPSMDDYVFDVIESILGRGRTSRLYKELIQKKRIAESVSAYAGSPGARYSNLFMVYATPRYPHTLCDIEKSVNDEINRIKNIPVSDQEMQRVKNQLKADFIRTLATNSGIASSLSYYEALLGDYRYISRYNKIIEKITPADVLRVADTYFNNSNRTVVRMKKTAEAQGSKIQ